MTAVSYDTQSLALAWTHTRLFWSLSLRVIGQHPFPLLVCAAIPAAERAFVRLQRHDHFTHSQLAALEFVVLLARLLLVTIALQSVLSASEWNHLTASGHPFGAMQDAAQRVGLLIGHHIRLLLWELLFFAVGFLALDRLLLWLPRWLARAGVAFFEPEPRQAILTSVLRNLLLAPLSVIYFIEIFRPAFQ